MDLIKELSGYGKLAIIGVGSEIKKDDAIGVHIVKKLEEKVKNDNILFLIGGTTPENLGGLLRKEKPSHILMIDAAQMGKAPGTISVFDPEKIRGVGFSTHTFSLGKIAEYLKDATGAKIIVMGIEPSELGFGDELSAVAQKAAEEAITLVEAAI